MQNRKYNFLIALMLLVILLSACGAPSAVQTEDGAPVHTAAQPSANTPLPTDTLPPAGTLAPIPEEDAAASLPQTLKMETPFLIAGADETELLFSCFLSEDDASLHLEAPYGNQRFPLACEHEPLTGRHAFHTVLTDLEPNTTYRYYISADDTRTPKYTFSTGDFGEAPFSFLFAADPQLMTFRKQVLSADWKHSVDLAREDQSGIAFLLSGGDQVNEPDIEELYELFDVDNLFAQFPLAPCRGNHDAACTLYGAHFPVPNFDEQTCGYYFFYNDALFAVLDTNEKDHAADGDFLRNAKNAFRRVKGGESGWFIIAMHHPMFSNGDYSLHYDTLARQKALAPIFSELDVDLVLTGHEHQFSRSRLMSGEEIAENPESAFEHAKKLRGQTLYLTAGTASGCKYYEVDEETLHPHSATSLEIEQPQITRVDVSAESLIITTFATEDSLYPIDTFTLEK